MARMSATVDVIAGTTRESCLSAAFGHYGKMGAECRAGKRAEAREIEARKVPPVSEIGRKFRVQLGQPELHQAIAAPFCKGRLYARGHWRGWLRGQQIKRAVRR